MIENLFYGINKTPEYFGGMVCVIHTKHKGTAKSLNQIQRLKGWPRPVRFQVSRFVNPDKYFLYPIFK